MWNKAYGLRELINIMLPSQLMMQDIQMNNIAFHLNCYILTFLSEVDETHVSFLYEYYS